jgi:uncharacterized membrane protein YbhN (UPF0104 family)
VVLLAALVTSLLLTVPQLNEVATDVGNMSAGWVVAAIALELASCASFGVIFRLFFDRIPAVPAHQLAWTEMGSGALLPGGGAGGLAVGAWLMHVAGMPRRHIVERSSALFVLTSATNVIAMVGAAVLLATGVSAGPSQWPGFVLPIAGALVCTAIVLALPRVAGDGRIRARAGWGREILDGIRGAEQALRSPGWRLLGAVGYLGFDIAVLWATFQAVGYPIAIAPLVLGYLIGYLGNLLPVPGGIGVLDAGLAATLVLYGAPATQTAAAVLVYHAIALWIPGLGGLIAYSLLRRRLVRPGTAVGRVPVVAEAPAVTEAPVVAEAPVAA